MSILDSNGIIVYEQTGDTTDNALTELLRKWSYQVRVQGDSSGNPYGNPGWSAYGSLGQYQLDFARPT